MVLDLFLVLVLLLPDLGFDDVPLGPKRLLPRREGWRGISTLMVFHLYSGKLLVVEIRWL